jgi:hypothetical protein
MATIREVKESPQPQGVSEIVAYTLDTTPWNSLSPASSVVAVYDVTKGGRKDVTLVVMPSGSSSESGTVITTPALKLLTAGRDYRIEILWEDSGNTFEAFGIVNGEQ